jgi:nucleoside-diphosphate-sugar epimerase
MRILLTGGSGFLGSHLRSELELAGHETINVDLVADDQPFVSWRGDLLDAGIGETSAILNGAIRMTDADVVVHLAAQVGRLFGEDDLGHTIRSNALMTALVARSCSLARTPPRLVYTSTSEIYGDVDTMIATEGPEPGFAPTMRLPHNLYGLSKRWGEEAAALYATASSGYLPKVGGLQVIRPSMPYGPGLPPGRGRAAIVNMLWQAENRQPIIVHAGAERSWCWVGDTAAGIRAVIELGDWAIHADSWRRGVGCYNVGRDDAGVSMLAVAQLACELTGADEGLIEEVPRPERQTLVKRLSTDKLRALGWAPAVDLRNGMQLTLRYMREAGQMAAL